MLAVLFCGMLLAMNIPQAMAEEADGVSNNNAASSDEQESISDNDIASSDEQESTSDNDIAPSDEQDGTIPDGEEQALSMMAELGDVAPYASGISYLDATGNMQTCSNATEITASTTTWNAGWYVANGNVTIGSRVTVNGSVHLILADGADLTVNGGIEVDVGNSITIYAQSKGAGKGKLKASGGTSQAGIGGKKCIEENGTWTGYPSGDITIHGGDIDASATGSTGEPAGIGGGGYGDAGNIVITGGKVKAGGCGKGIGSGARKTGGSILISGGFVESDGIGVGGYSERVDTIISGEAVVIAGDKGIYSTQKDQWSGLVFENKTGKIYGNNNVTLTEDFTIDKYSYLSFIIDAGQTFTIASGKTLTNRGMTITNNGTIINNGSIHNGEYDRGYYGIINTTNGNIKGDGQYSSEGGTVHKATPTITPPTAKTLTYNGSAQALIDAGSTTAGQLLYSTDNTNWVSNAGDVQGTTAGNHTVYYKVAGSWWCNEASGNMTAAIAKTTPTPTTPSNLTAVYGNTLSSVALPSGWAWDNPSASVGNAGTNAFPATYTPADTANYNTVKQNLTVAVSRANQAALRIHTVGSMAYGDSFTLSTSGGSGKGAVTFTCDDTNKISINGTTATIIAWLGGTKIKAQKAADDNYNAAVTSLDFTPEKKAVVFKANDVSVMQGDPMPTDFTYAPVTLVGSDSITTEPTVSCAATDTDTVGVFLITVNGAVLTNGNYYNVSYAPGKLTVTARPATGGGSGSSGGGGGSYTPPSTQEQTKPTPQPPVPLPIPVPTQQPPTSVWQLTPPWAQKQPPTAVTPTQEKSLIKEANGKTGKDAAKEEISGAKADEEVTAAIENAETGGKEAAGTDEIDAAAIDTQSKNSGTLGVVLALCFALPVAGAGGVVVWRKWRGI